MFHEFYIHQSAGYNIVTRDHMKLADVYDRSQLIDTQGTDIAQARKLGLIQFAHVPHLMSYTADTYMYIVLSSHQASAPCSSLSHYPNPCVHSQSEVVYTLHVLFLVCPLTSLLLL